MKPRRLARKTKGPGVTMNFTAPMTEAVEIDEAAVISGLTRASFVYRAVRKEVRLVQRRVAKTAAVGKK